MKVLYVLTIAMYAHCSMANSFSISGVYENTEGCRVLVRNCSMFKGSDNKITKNCSIEVYKKDEYFAGLGKGGKVISKNGSLVTASDKGIRSSNYGLELVNTQAQIEITKSVHDPSLYADIFVLGFNLEIEDRKINSGKFNCPGLILMNDLF